MIPRRRFLALFGSAPAVALGSGAMPPSPFLAAARTPVREPSVASILEDCGANWPNVMARLAEEARCPSRGPFAGSEPGRCA